MKFLKKLAEKSINLHADAAVTVVTFGDSVTQGCFECYRNGEKTVETEFDPQNAYSQKFVHILRTLYPRAQINLVNSGISGDSAVNAVSRLERAVLRYTPDVVIVCFGLNDSTRGVEGIGMYAEALRKIFTAIKESGSECIFMTPNMMNTYRNMHLLDEVSIGLAPIFAKLQNEGIIDQYVDAARGVAQECGVRVCDAYARWKKMHSAGVDTTALLANYLNHPTREMHWLFANALIDTVFED